MAIAASRFFSTDPGQLTPDVEDRFFTALKTRNNTFKRTASDRFQMLDNRCVRRFETTGSPLRAVLDIGVSSGSTTLALRDRLHRVNLRPDIVGTDLSLTAYLVPIAGGMRALVDEQGHAMQYEVLGRAVRAWRRRADYFTGVAGGLWLIDRLGRRSIRRALERGWTGTREVRLLSPRLASQPDIRIEKNDILKRTPDFVGRFDFVRAANVLNLGYFDEPLLRAAFANIFAYLTGPGAWLLVARSSGEKTAATLFRISPDGGRLLVVDRINGGSEVERLVLSTPLPHYPAEA